MAQIAITFDIETLYGSPLGSGLNKQSLVREVNHILQLCSDTDIKATFFVVGKLVSEYKELIRSIAENGHELASHSMSHTFFHKLNEEDIRHEILDSKKALEDAAGVTVEGFRAPAWSICEHFQAHYYTCLKEAGYSYSSSVYPGKTPLYGIPAAKPQMHLSPEGIVEFPMPTLSIFGKRFGFSGGAFYRALPDFIVKNASKSFLRNNEQMFFYFHPYEFDVCDYSYISSIATRMLIMYNRKQQTERIKELIRAKHKYVATMKTITGLLSCATQ